MTQTSFSFPDWIDEFVPDDEVFARAYESIPDANRALLKTGIARLYDWYGPNKIDGSEVARHWASGLRSKTVTDLADFSILLFDDSLLSPARVLAALVPAIACGVRSVLAVRVDGKSSWPESVLTGLELAGQELVAEMTETQARRLLGELRDSGTTGAVTVLGPKAASVQTAELQAASRLSFWRPRFTRTAVIWMEDESTFDLEPWRLFIPTLRLACLE